MRIQLPLDQLVVVGVPAYNEGRFIGSLVLSLCSSFDIVVVVDDGSTDQTAAIAEAAGAVVVRHPQNQGKGRALNTLFAKAREFDPDALVILDGDAQHRVEEIPSVVEPILDRQADIVVGTRYGTGSEQVPAVRRAGHAWFNSLTAATSGVWVSDSQSGFRAFSRRALEVLSFSSSGFAVESEMQFLARDYGLRVKEVDISVVYADPPKRNVFHHGTMVLNGLLRLVGQHRPLLFFGMIGLLFLLGGLSLGSLVVVIYYQSQVLAVGYAILTAVLCIIAALAFFTGVILHSVRALLIDFLRAR